MSYFGEIALKPWSEQRALLNANFFRLRPLSVVGHLDVGRVIQQALLPIVTFLFAFLVLTSSTLRYGNDGGALLIANVGLVLLLALPTLALSVLFVGVVSTSWYSRVRWEAVVYWTWWPFWKLVLCVAAAAVGSVAGDKLWTRYFFPHLQLQRMQAYQALDLGRVSGVRLQDAGIVVFDENSTVSREAGCYKRGTTYCVAPVLLKEGHQRNYDVFMVGTDCCSCPGEFRCGDWSTPSVPGGLRVVEEHLTKMYSLAAEDWIATHSTSSSHPIFFHWVSSPVSAYRFLQSRGLQLYGLSLCVLPAVLLFITVFLNGFLLMLCEFQVAAPLEAPMPPAGLGQVLAKSLLPRMYKYSVENRAESRAV